MLHEYTNTGEALRNVAGEDGSENDWNTKAAKGAKL
jgi:hypothetical protein